jgi:hypothetical protein
MRNTLRRIALAHAPVGLLLALAAPRIWFT